MTDFLILDVFTTQACGGNQLAVIPDASTLPEAALQPIAREFNYSETVFFYPPDDPAHTARVRIFTPTMEVPFAGHPVIGSAVALAGMGHGPEMMLELGIGPLPVRASGSEAEFRTKVPLTVNGRPEAALTARCLALPEAAVIGTPTQCGVGLDFVLTELRSRADLAAAMPVTDAFREAAKLHPAGLDFAIYAYVREGETIHARMFAPLDQIPEDPATGSAAAALTAFLAHGGPLSLTIHQGEDMGRPSLIHARAENGAIHIAGSAVTVMSGQLLEAITGTGTARA